MTTGELLDTERVTSSSERGSWKSVGSDNSLAAYSTHAGIRAAGGRITVLPTATPVNSCAMIRIVTWNCCRGKPEAKLPCLLALNPDVVVVQECARPADLNRETEVWYGDNPNQGLLVLVNNGFYLKPSNRKRITAKFFLPVQVAGKATFNLLAIWAKPSQRRPIYVNTLFRGIAAYRDFIKSTPCIILGDLNTARYLSAGDSHMQFVNLLKDEFGLVSAYHKYFGVDHGRETHNTYFDRTNRGKPFHIDYCFIPKSWLPMLKKVTVGCPRDWLDLSDHTPLIIEVNK